ncbi:ABC transporter ATP-binding protein [Sulfobacillus thermotolerans]|uniref:ABC transporter ATP-binding protein n=1 Tax=Sulfobacillus thermotolerans TaxID=338644 RepID=UPI0033681CD3
MVSHSVRIEDQEARAPRLSPIQSLLSRWKTGWHQLLLGMELTRSSILGIGRKAIEAKMEEIIDFAEIRPFIDTPVKYYSSGMHARLGFAVATSVDPEILIVDEILAVGDEAFQQKCMDRIFHMKREGTSILLVSHDLSSIERLMDQAVWINKGVMQKTGAPRDVVLAYRQSLMGQTSQGTPEPEATVAHPGPIQVAQAFLKSQGKAVDALVSGDPVSVTLDLRNDSAEEFVGHVSLVLRRPDGLELATFSTVLDGVPIRLKPGMNRVSVDMAQLFLTSGAYDVTVAIYDQNGRRLDEWPGVLPVRIQALRNSPGLLVLPHTWRMD